MLIIYCISAGLAESQSPPNVVKPGWEKDTLDVSTVACGMLMEGALATEAAHPEVVPVQVEWVFLLVAAAAKEGWRC